MAPAQTDAASKWQVKQPRLLQPKELEQESETLIFPLNASVDLKSTEML